MNRQPPRWAEVLLALVAGPSLQEEIVGDLHEQYMDRPSRRWYWSQVLRSVPALGVMHLRSLSPWNAAFELTFIAVVVTSIWVWEIAVARAVSWPIAQHLMALSPLSAHDTCKLTYVALSTVAAGVGLGLVATWQGRFRQTWQLQVWRALIIGLGASSMVVVLFLSPGPYDGHRWYRGVQLIALWSCFGLYFTWRSLSRGQDGEPRGWPRT